MSEELTSTSVAAVDDEANVGSKREEEVSIQSPEAAGTGVPAPLAVAHPESASLAPPSPGQGVPLEGEELLQALRRQMEYYFSRQNLANDTYLISKMTSDMWCKLDVVCSFPKIRSLSEDKSIIVKSIGTSKDLEYDEKKEMVRPKMEKPHRRTLILREIPNSTPVDEVKAIFDDLFADKENPVVSIRSDIGDTWFVDFKDDKTAQNAVFELMSKQFHGKPIKARVKSETLLRGNGYPAGGAFPTSPEMTPAGAIAAQAPPGQPAGRNPPPGMFYVPGPGVPPGGMQPMYRPGPGGWIPMPGPGPFFPPHVGPPPAGFTPPAIQGGAEIQGQYPRQQGGDRRGRGGRGRGGAPNNTGGRGAGEPPVQSQNAQEGDLQQRGGQRPSRGGGRRRGGGGDRNVGPAPVKGNMNAPQQAAPSAPLNLQKNFPPLPTVSRKSQPGGAPGFQREFKKYKREEIASILRSIPLSQKPESLQNPVEALVLKKAEKLEIDLPVVPMTEEQIMEMNSRSYSGIGRHSGKARPRVKSYQPPRTAADLTRMIHSERQVREAPAHLPHGKRKKKVDENTAVHTTTSAKEEDNSGGAWGGKNNKTFADALKGGAKNPPKGKGKQLPHWQQKGAEKEKAAKEKEAKDKVGKDKKEKQEKKDKGDRHQHKKKEHDKDKKKA